LLADVQEAVPFSLVARLGTGLGSALASRLTSNLDQPLHEMTHSLIGADRATHFKIVVVALVSAIVLVTVGITSRIADPDTAANQLRAEGPVLKAGKPASVTARDGTDVR